MARTKRSPAPPPPPNAHTGHDGGRRPPPKTTRTRVRAPARVQPRVLCVGPCRPGPPFSRTPPRRWQHGWGCRPTSTVNMFLWLNNFDFESVWLFCGWLGGKAPPPAPGGRCCWEVTKLGELREV